MIHIEIDHLLLAHKQLRLTGFTMQRNKFIKKDAESFEWQSNRSRVQISLPSDLESELNDQFTSQLDKEISNFCKPKLNHKKVFDVQSSYPEYSEVSSVQEFSKKGVVESEEGLQIKSIDDEEIYRVPCINRQVSYVIDVDEIEPPKPNMLKILLEEQMMFNKKEPSSRGRKFEREQGLHQTEANCIKLDDTKSNISNQSNTSNKSLIMSISSSAASKQITNSKNFVGAQEID